MGSPTFKHSKGSTTYVSYPAKHLQPILCPQKAHTVVPWVLLPVQPHIYPQHPLQFYPTATRPSVLKCHVNFFLSLNAGEPWGHPQYGLTHHLHTLDLSSAGTPSSVTGCPLGLTAPLFSETQRQARISETHVWFPKAATLLCPHRVLNTRA